MSERKPFKDYFDRDAAEALGRMLQAGVPAFKLQRFVSHSTRGLEELEMMDRVRQFSAALRNQLPETPTDAFAALSSSLPEPLPDCDNVMDGHLLWPVGQAIAELCTPALTPKQVGEALDCMEQLTQRFSAEFAVRPYVQEHEAVVLARLHELTAHHSPHVRRWCSEGTRPRLPWGQRIDPSRKSVLAILEELRADPSRYVQKSVANHLNDLAKDHPDLVLATCQDWLAHSDSDGAPSTAWIVRHALRSLIKAAHPRALALMGFAPPTKIVCEFNASPATLRIGETAQLSLEITNQSTRKQRLLIDYRVHYIKANGKSSAKVFKWTQVELGRGERKTLEKKQPFRDVTIRRLHSGTHDLDVQVNGVVLANTQVELGR